MRKAVEDYTGLQFGDWKVIEYAGKAENQSRLWLCQCVNCGAQLIKNTTRAKAEFQHLSCPMRRKEKPKKKKEDPNDKNALCKSGCRWWMRISTSYGYACHYCYYVGKRRERDEKGNCLSFDSRRNGEHRTTDIIFGKITCTKGE